MFEPHRRQHLGPLGGYPRSLGLISYNANRAHVRIGKRGARRVLRFASASRGPSQDLSPAAVLLLQT